MRIKFWGTRGSIPVPDSRMMKYGGDTTCLSAELDGRLLVIDAGTGIRKVGEEIMRRGIYQFDMFLTHSHWDHIQGFPFFLPVYSQRVAVNIYGCTSSYKTLKDILSRQMSQEYFPMRFSDLKARIDFVPGCEEVFQINGHKIRTINANHPLFTVGLRVEKGGTSFVFITDNELKQESPATAWSTFVEFCYGADYLVHDAQFTESEYAHRRGWGHSTFDQVLELARAAEVKN